MNNSLKNNTYSTHSIVQDHVKLIYKTLKYKTCNVIFKKKLNV